MPTKPIQSFVFATGVNYAVGPQAGNPTKIVPGDTIKGFIPTLALGLAGSLVGWLIFTKVFGIGDTEVLDLGGLPGAIIGSALVLGGFTLAQRKGLTKKR